MKNIRYSMFAAAAALAIALPLAAQATDGTITFNGKITNQTCDISGGTGGKTFQVNMPTVSVSALAAAGDVAGSTPFAISLTNCSPDSGNVSTLFEMGGTVNTNTGSLKNTVGTGMATNVEVQLLNGDNTAIKLGQAQASQNSNSVAISAGAATLNYIAQYSVPNTSSTGAGAGTVLTSVTYSMSYN